MNKDCPIVEDLLLLYHEGLVQEETAKWLENHLQSCEHCRGLVELAQEPLEKEAVTSPVDPEKMMKKVHLKLSIFQIIFVTLSFLFAIKTSLLNNSFGFILSYTILGFVTYLFYRRILLVITITFLPNFIWSIIDIGGTDAKLGFSAVIGSVFLALIHLLFAIIGSIIGLLVIKIKEMSENT